MIKDILLQIEAEIDSNDKYISEYEDTAEQRAFNTGMRNIYNIIKRRFEKQSGWISVEDRLPEFGELVLVTIDKPLTRLNFPYEEQVLILFRAKIGIKTEWKRPHSSETINYNDRVTHWMPLPKAPKMKGE